MAYLTNTQDLQKNTQGINNPNSQSAQGNTNPDGSPQNPNQAAPTQPNTGNPAQSASPSAPQPSQPTGGGSRPAKQAGSGNFTNLNTYAKQNAPKAEQSAQQIAQGVQSQLNKTQTEAKQMQQQYNANVGQAQQKVQAEKDVAKQLTDRIVGNTQAPAQAQTTANQPQTTQPAQAEPLYKDDEYARVRAAVQGQANLDNIGEIDLNKQMFSAQQKEQQAAKASTEQGRQQLLKDTFAKQNQYNAGQQRLDDFLLKSSGEANKLKGTLQQQAVNTKDQLQNLRRDALQNLQGYNANKAALGTDVQNILTGGTQTVDQQVQQQLAQEKAAREGLNLSELEQGVQSSLAKMTGKFGTTVGDALKLSGGRLAGDGVAIGQSQAPRAMGGNNILNQPINDAINYQNQTRATNDANANKKMTEMTNAFIDHGGSIQDIPKFIRQLTEGKLSEADKAILGDYGLRDVSQSVGTYGKMLKDEGFSVADLGANVANKAKALESLKAENILGAKLANQGLDYSTARDASKITAQQAATKQDAMRYNALMDLMQGANLGDRTYRLDDTNIGRATTDTAKLAELRKKELENLSRAGYTNLPTPKTNIN